MVNPIKGKRGAKAQINKTSLEVPHLKENENSEIESRKRGRSRSVAREIVTKQHCATATEVQPVKQRKLNYKTVKSKKKSESKSNKSLIDEDSNVSHSQGHNNNAKPVHKDEIANKRSMRNEINPTQESSNGASNTEDFDQYDQEIDDEHINQYVPINVGVTDEEDGEFRTGDEDSEMESMASDQSDSGEEDSEVGFKSPPKEQNKREDPDIEDYIQQQINKRWKAKEKEFEKKIEELSKKGTNNSKEQEVIFKTPVKSDKQKGNVIEKERLRSPSNTTLYAPGLMKGSTPNRNNMETQNKQKLELMERISDIVESIRISTEGASQMEADNGPSTSTGITHNNRGKQTENRDIAAKLLIEAEKFKATLNPPEGKEEITDFKGVENDCEELLEDDDFFHIACHVDQNLKDKIERGKFVELEKLLVRDRFRRRNEEDKLEFYHRDGHTFLAPVQDRSNTITNVRRWEQAFRVYAAIFSKANPHRAAEIWQYVYVINTAASTFVWENVAFYDYTFRQMMSINPKRSWAKTYNQMWNIAMQDKIPPRSNGTGVNYPSGNNHSHSNNHSSKSFGNAAKSGKEGFRKKNGKGCWRFNRNEPCNASSCDFEHKCSFCGGRSHAVIDCNKLKSKESGKKN